MKNFKDHDPKKDRADFFRSLTYTAKCAGLFGLIAAAGGIAVTCFAAPLTMAITATVCAGVAGFAGTALSALDAGTSGRGNSDVVWPVGLATTAALCCAAYFGVDYVRNTASPLAATPALTSTFKGACTPTAAVTKLNNVKTPSCTISL